METMGTMEIFITETIKSLQAIWDMWAEAGGPQRFGVDDMTQRWYQDTLRQLCAYRDGGPWPKDPDLLWDLLLWALETLLTKTLDADMWFDNYQATAQSEKTWRAQAEELVVQNRDLQAQVLKLAGSKVTLPPATITVRSELQRALLSWLATDGLGRAWRLGERALAAGLATNANSVRNALRKLEEQGLIRDYQHHGRVERWSPLPGGARRLVVLTEKGRQWAQATFQKPPADSEITRMAQQHKSVAHGVSILEARDHLRAAGYSVDDAPEAILAQADAQWGVRAEPDLLVEVDGVCWPVEVQREVAERLNQKWRKLLKLAGRMVLILCNETQLHRQQMLLYQLDLQGELPEGAIRLTSLEAMEQGAWAWQYVTSVVADLDETGPTAATAMDDAFGAYEDWPQFADTPDDDEFISEAEFTYFTDEM